jgi:DNA repair protein RadC
VLGFGEVSSVEHEDAGPGLRLSIHRPLLKRLIGARKARRLYQGSLQPLFAPTADQAETAEACLIARELVQRWLSEQLTEVPVLTSPKTVRDYLRIHYAGRKYESFSVLFLDAQHRLIRAEELFRGTLTQTSVYPREVVKAALQHNAAAVLLAHNHPSGVAEPSRADEALTQALKQALALVDMRVLDHFVVAGSGVVSFVERGLL